MAQVGWSDLLVNTHAYNWALGFPTLISTPSRSCWSLWKNWSCWAIPASSQRYRTPQGRSHRDPVRMGYQKPEILNHTDDSLQWTVASQADGTKGYSIWHTKPPMPWVWVMRRWRGRREKEAEIFLFLVWVLFCFGLLEGCCCSYFCFLPCLLCFVFFIGGMQQGWGESEGTGNEHNWGAEYETTKDSVRKLKKITKKKSNLYSTKLQNLKEVDISWYHQPK